MKTLISLTAASVLLFSTASFADNCEQAAYFYKKGQYGNVKTIISPLVSKGEACAEYYMGMLYFEGYSVKANEKKALKLIRSDESKGYAEAISFIKSYH